MTDTSERKIQALLYEMANQIGDPLDNYERANGEKMGGFPITILQRWEKLFADAGDSLEPIPTQPSEAEVADYPLTPTGSARLERLENALREMQEAAATALIIVTPGTPHEEFLTAIHRYCANALSSGQPVENGAPLAAAGFKIVKE